MRTVTPSGHPPEVWAPLLDSADLIDPSTLITSAASHRTGIDRGEALVVVAAHPDDETIGAGRLISWWARTAGPVHAVVLTAGEACVDQVATRPLGLAQRRLTEWSTALDRLGVGGERITAQLADGRIAAAGNEAVNAIAQAVAAAGHQARVILAPWPLDPHPDHAAAGRAAAVVARRYGLVLLHYPIWMTYWQEPRALTTSRDRLVRVSTEPSDELARAAALEAFTSQFEPLAVELAPVVPATMLDHHRSQVLLIPIPDRSVSTTRPLPAHLGLPHGYDRHAPSAAATASAMRHLVASRPWRELSWPDLVDSLVALGRTDVPLARLVEGHIDAVRILDQADSEPVSGALYGVWASRSRGTGVQARPDPGGWRLDGTLRFSSGAGVIDRALVPVWPDDDTHLLLDLPVAQWPADESAWQTEAMAVSRSHPTRLDAVVAGVDSQRGPADFYLTRAGFHAGGLGVAAVWVGCAARVIDLVLDHLADAPASSTRSVRLGRMRADLASALATLDAGADRLTAALAGEDLPLIGQLAAEARSVCASATLRILDEAKVVVGPAGLSYDAAFTHAVADLDLYVRQFNADAEFGRLGGDLA